MPASGLRLGTMDGLERALVRGHLHEETQHPDKKKRVWKAMRRVYELDPEMPCDVEVLREAGLQAFFVGRMDHLYVNPRPKVQVALRCSASTWRWSALHRQFEHDSAVSPEVRHGLLQILGLGCMAPLQQDVWWRSPGASEKDYYRG